MERFGSIVTFITGAVFQIVQRLRISGEFLGALIGQQRPKFASCNLPSCHREYSRLISMNSALHDIHFGFVRMNKELIDIFSNELKREGKRRRRRKVKEFAAKQFLS